MFIKKIILILSIALISSIAKAEETAEKAEIFKVEIIVFENLAQKGWVEEYWPQDIDLINTNRAINTTALSRHSNMLNGAKSRMTRAAGYNILFHKSWLINAQPRSKTQPILINTNPQSAQQSSLNGYLHFYKERFVHVDIKLDLDKKIPTTIKEKFAKQQNIPINELPNFWQFQIKESRKIRSNQLHYIDHPLFGALVQIRWQRDM